MSVLVRVEVMTQEATLEIAQSAHSGNRSFRVRGGDHLTVEMDRLGDKAILTLRQVPEGVARFCGVPPERADMCMSPVPASPRAGVYEVVNGREAPATDKKAHSPMFPWSV